MKNRMKLLSILALAISALGTSAPAALAAPPSNDTFTDAKPVVVGDSDVIDTTEATTDSDDAHLNDACGAPATDASVWYALDGSDTVVEVDVSQSSYSASILVGVGSQGNLQPITCGSGGIVPEAFFALAGTTYYVLVIDDQGDGGDNGGILSISFNEFPTTVDITGNRFGTVNRP